MERNPSLHIRKSDLIEILNQISFKGRVYGYKVADEIFDKAQPYQIKDRYLSVIQSKANTKKKLVRSMQADQDMPEYQVEKFNGILTSYRQKKNTFGKIKPILKTSKDYLMLKEVAKLAYDFTQHFEITSLDDGYLEYIETGMSMMRKYALNRFKYYDSKIYEYFEDKVTVVTDKNREATLQFYYIWRDVMMEYSGLEELLDIENNYQKFVHIVLGRREADRLKADYTDWITAQFEGLVFLDAVPELSQFYGDGAEKRYERYLRNSIEYSEDEKSITDYYDED